MAGSQRFRLWLRDCTALPASKNDPFSHEDLTVAFLGLSSSREILVKLIRVQGENPARRLKPVFLLTARQGEVLCWLSMGKSTATLPRS